MAPSKVDKEKSAFTRMDGVRNFYLEELVDKPFMQWFGASAIRFLNHSLVLCIDRLRDAVGPITVNDWHIGGPFHESGLRRFDTATGAEFSQHKYGNAFDLKPKQMTALQLYQHIIANASRYPQITTIENPETTKTWLHVDGRWHAGNAIIIVEP